MSRNAGFKAKSYSNLEQRQIHSPTLVGYYMSKCIKATWNCLFVHLTKFCMLYSFVLSILNVCMHPFYCTLASWKKFRLWIFFYFKPSEWFWPYWKTPPLTLLSRKYRHQFHAASNWFPIVSVFLTYALFTNLHCFHSSNDWCLKGSFLLSLSPCHMHFFFSNDAMSNLLGDTFEALGSLAQFVCAPKNVTQLMCWASEALKITFFTQLDASSWDIFP